LEVTQRKVTPSLEEAETDEAHDRLKRTEDRAEGKKQLSKGEPYAADEILTVDCVMRDFVDEPSAPYENDQWEPPPQP
jgi:hypothetical protein